jgi:hypothetical protein
MTIKDKTMYKISIEYLHPDSSAKRKKNVRKADCDHQGKYWPSVKKIKLDLYISTIK